MTDPSARLYKVIRRPFFSRCFGSQSLWLLGSLSDVQILKFNIPQVLAGFLGLKLSLQCLIVRVFLEAKNGGIDNLSELIVLHFRDEDLLQRKVQFLLQINEEEINKQGSNSLFMQANKLRGPVFRNSHRSTINQMGADATALPSMHSLAPAEAASPQLGCQLKIQCWSDGLMSKQS